MDRKADTAAADAKPSERSARDEGKPRSTEVANGAAAPRTKDVEMKDATDGGRRAADKAAEKPAADGGDKEVTRLHVGRLTRNVKEEHVREIFGTFGKLKVTACHALLATHALAVLILSAVCAAVISIQAACQTGDRAVP